MAVGSSRQASHVQKGRWESRQEGHNEREEERVWLAESHFAATTITGNCTRPQDRARPLFVQGSPSIVGLGRVPDEIGGS